ncbi:MAG: hypothetical protein MJZ64_06355 [Paludibacteraceae bacterium]|nr:hypothetical protein [Paludibacteraceae bacterium]
MNIKRFIFGIPLLAASMLSAQNVYDIKTSYYGTKPEAQKSKAASQKAEDEDTKSNGIYTGFSGGMMLHIGYAFAKSGDEMFHNGSLENKSGIPKGGVTLGIGGALRIHLLDHVHVGVEGGVSTMPLENGSSIRNGWGGAICDYYGVAGKAKLFIGGLIGGGSQSRLFVPKGNEEVQGDEVVYNASYTKTPYFLLDPYMGVEFAIAKHIDMLIKLDYMLPIGEKNTGIHTEKSNWRNFLAPTGPRLYIGFMFGHSKRR